MAETKQKKQKRKNPLIGKVLQGNYLLEKQVGVGGMAWVFKATHTKLQEPMAVKVLLPHIAQETELVDRFINEGKIQFKLKHPNIVQVTDIIDSDGIIGIVMEWVNGENLKQFLKRVGLPLPLKDVWLLMAPVLDAVGYAHKRGIVHRDLKPPNIMLHQAEGELIPKVADFGIAKVLDAAEQHTTTGTVMGTIKYMSPEQMRDSKSVDARSDIYSLGVIIYLMATGRLPFSGSNELIIYKTMNEPPPQPSAINPRLPKKFDDVMRKCLAKTPDERYSSCEELSHAFSLALLSAVKAIDEESTQQLSPLEVQKMLMDSHVAEPSQIYISSIYPSPQSASSVDSLGDRQQSESSNSYPPQETPPAPNDKNLPTGVPVKLPKPQLRGIPLNSQDSSFSQQPSPSKEKPSPSTSSQEEASPQQQAAVQQQAPALAKGITLSAELELDAPADSISLISSDEKSSSKLIISLLLALIIILLGIGTYLYLSPRQKSSDTPPPSSRKAPKIAQTSSHCKEGTRRACYPKKKGCRKEGNRFLCRGICQAGHQICQTGKWGPCLDAILPKKEICNGKDDDCNGYIDESFPKQGQPCTVKRGDCLLSGTYQCHPKLGKVICRINPKSRIKGRHLILKIYPKNLKVKLTYRGKKRFARSRYCLGFKGRRRIRVRFSARRYFTCILTLRYRNKPIIIRMKRNNGLAPDPDYCKRR